MYFMQKEGVEKEGRFGRKEDFHTKGTLNHITTGTEQLQMSFYKFGNKKLKIFIIHLKTVLWEE